VIGSKPKADALNQHRPTATATGQRPPQGQTLAASLQAQTHPTGRQLGVVQA